MSSDRSAAFWVLAILFVVIPPGCKSDEEDHKAPFASEHAIALVERYNELVPEAYRTVDPDLTYEVAGPEEHRKIAGLIGVKKDMGLTLDSTLEDFGVESVQSHSADVVEVTTFERWSYVDRRIGSGEIVSPVYEDRYHMRYVLREVEGGWKVVAIRYEDPPELGRPLSETPGAGPPSHGPMQFYPDAPAPAAESAPGATHSPESPTP